MALQFELVSSNAVIKIVIPSERSKLMESDLRGNESDGPTSVTVICNIKS